MRLTTALLLATTALPIVTAAQPAAAAPAAPAGPAATAPGTAARAVAAPAAAAPTVAPAASPTAAATASATAAPTASATAAPAATAPVTVARYSFDAGAGTTGRVAENSGRGTALTVRAVDGGRVTFTGTTADRDAAFPAPCATTATTCPRAMLEGTDDPDLDPGTQQFRWGASVKLAKAPITGSSNVVQKGVANTGSQWKLQIGARQGRANCVLVGQGSAKVYLVRSSTGIADGQWHTVMCQRSGPVLAVYVDGQPRGRLTIPATLSIANNLPLRVGGPNLRTRTGMYHGLLDDVYARLG